VKIDNLDSGGQRVLPRRQDRRTGARPVEARLRKLSRRMRALVAANPVWTLALFETRPDPTGIFDGARPIKLFESRRVRMRLNHIHTRADPFLFVRDSHLYIFFEAQDVGGHGYIKAWRTSDLETYENLGILLEEPHHVSYPNVFSLADGVYLIPESRDANEVALYEFTDFPHVLKRRKRLLSGFYVDPTIVFRDGLWWLFATSDRGLDLFWTEDLLGGEFTPHPANPVTNDPEACRCAGTIVEQDGFLFRPAQRAIVEDGANVHFRRIETLTREAYREGPAAGPFFQLADQWNLRGAHHISSAWFKGRWVTAVDGRQSDFLANKLMSPVFQLLAMVGLIF
jgi:hypothetical protein